MGDANPSYEIEVFRDALMDDNISVQVDAIKRLPALAAAMDSEKTREVLLPCVVNLVDALPEEVCYNLAEQLERLVPFVGGNQYAGLLLNILVRVASEDEVLIRNRAIDAMKNIYQQLEDEQCENAFYPLIENLIKSDWFTTKCSAGCLIAISYPKMSKEKQTELKNFFRNLIQDDSPIVRRSTATSLVDLIPLLDNEEMKLEFIPVFDNLALDDQDSVRTLAVDVGIELSKKLKDYEIYEFLLSTFKMLAEDSSWRVRQRIACKIHEIETSEKNRDEIMNIYSKCVRDEESEVRIYAAKNIHNLAVNLQKSYNKDFEKYQDIFEKNMEENVIPEIHLMLRDPNDDVRVALSTNILALSSILRVECFNTNILPLVIDALENEEYMPFKENMLKNLSWLPPDIDITKSVKSISNVIQNLLENSQMHWRTRRNLLLAFIHMIRNSTSDFFDENLKLFYQFLLNDPIYAIRRIAPMILPLLIKHFGINWAKTSLIPIFVPFATDPRYLFRYVILFAIEELISPTLNQEKTILDIEPKYLGDLKKYQSKESTETLVKIVKLNEKLEEELLEDEDEIKHVNYTKENLQFYGEDTLENLKKEQVMIFSIKPEEIQDSYLEGILIMLIRDFIPVIKDLIDDPIKNVQDRAKITLKLVETFSLEIKKETKESWVQDVIKGMKEEDLQRIENEILTKIQKEKPQEDEIKMIDCDGENEENIEDENNNNNN